MDTVKLWLKYKDKFELFCLMLLIPIVYFALTPSSYGEVLNMMGFGKEGLVWGEPRAIRSDEWAVWTPYIQMAVLNGFERFNDLSYYHHDLKGFNAVPIADWALFFKPLMWPFWIFEPARAFALHYGLVMVLFLIGWKKLAFNGLNDLELSEQKKCWLAIFFSTLIFFTGFVQFWWTTLGPILALSPWLLLLVVRWRHSLIHYIAVFYVATVWLMSHTYPPVIISIFYFGLMLLFIHQSNWWSGSKFKILLTAIACLSSVGVTLWYFRDIIPLMINTVYPGERISEGGEGMTLIWLSTFLPFITHSGFEDLLSLNICEVGSLGTILPLSILCFVKPDWHNVVVKRASYILLPSFLIASLWMLTPIPSSIGKYFLLDKVPGYRMILLIGLIVNYYSFILFSSGKVLVSRFRLTAFVIILTVGYLLPSFLSMIGFFNKSFPELVSIILVLSWFVLKGMKVWKDKYSVVFISFMILGTNFFAYYKFNPVQKAFPIFNLNDRQVVKDIRLHAQSMYPYWVVDRELPGAVLSGLGVNSFTTVLTKPNVSVFKQLYPSMPDVEFNHIFNRYAHVTVSNATRYPTNPSPDVINIPLNDVMDIPPLVYKVYSGPISEFQSNVGGSVDSVSTQGQLLTISGWAWKNPGIIYGDFPAESVVLKQTEMRNDVVKAMNNEKLIYSGFILSINLPESLNDVLNNGICLYSQDEYFGYKRLDTSNLPLNWQCRKFH
ncbi:hypothetical protein KW453_18600 [Vibrio fluvialis]|nr:hypothetical protein [Vibrio fluvialis]MBY7980051.1 hypothetical protein [Vibrio fluvialis]